MPAPLRKSASLASLARRRHHRLTGLGAGLFMATLAPAADFYKADNESALNTIAAWVNSDGTPIAAAPDNNANTNTWYWDNRVLSATYLDGVQNVLLGADRWTGNLVFSDMGVPVIITGATNQSLTIGGTGIDMSAATHDVTFQTFNTGSNVGIRLHSGSASYTFSVAAGRTLTFNAAKIAVRSGGSNSVVNFPGPGKVVFNDQFQTSHAVITGGRVEFNCPSGSTRIATDSTINPVSYTNIDGGVVMVNNTSGSATGDSIVNVNNGGTLGGAGKITGSTNSVVNANAGSILAPGNDAVGTLSIGKLNLAAGSRIIWEGDNEVSSDLIAITTAGGLTIEGTTLTDDADSNHPLISLYNPGTTTPFSSTGLFNLITFTGSVNGAGLDALRIDPATILPGQTYTLGLGVNAQGANVVTLEISDGIVTPSDWTADASGNWSVTTNWTGGIVPDAVKAIARISGAGTPLTAPRTITLDTAPTLGKLYLDSAHAITVAGPGPITFDQGPGAATLFADGGNHLVQTPLVLTDGGLTTTVDDAAQTLSISGVISGTDAGLIKIGAGTLVLTADNTYTGATSVALGTLQIGGGGATGSVAGLLSNSAKIRFNRSDSITLANPISGTGSVEFAGAGGVTLSAANTYSGATTVSAGTLTLANSLALQSSTLNYSATGGSLAVADPLAAISLGGLSGDGALPLSNSAAAPLALTVGGNNASTTYSGSPTGTGYSFTKTGSGSLTLTGVHSYDDSLTTPASFDATVGAGSLVLETGAVFNAPKIQVGTGTNAKLTINGGTLNSTAETLVKNATLGLELVSGTANFNSLTTDIGNSAGTNFIKLTGGTLNATSISTGRSGSTISSEPTSGRTTDGLYIHGATVNVSDALNLGAASGANSSHSARMDSGSLTVAGLTTLGINNTGRWAVLDIAGGTFNANGGIQLGSASAGLVAMVIRNSATVVNTPGIQFGQAATAGTSILNLAGGSLYVGSGGLSRGSSGTLTASVKLGAGTLGATADWSSTLPVNISGFPSIVTGADATGNPHTITLHGLVGGIGGITKNGSGTVLMTDPANTYNDAVIVNGGTLGLAGSATSFGEFTINEGGKLQPIGVLNVTNTATINGGLSIRYNSAATTPVSRLSGQFDIILGANSSLDVSGVGTLPPGSYVIAKAAFGVTGAFASVNLPAGTSLNYNYDDGSGTPSVALVVEDMASPYETWAASFSLTGDDALASADPDADGLVNLLEYAFDTSPILSDASSAYLLDQAGNHLRITFDHPADATLTYAIEASNTLAADSWSVVHTFPAFTAEGTASYTDTAADLTVTPRRFLRVKVTPAP